MNDQTAPLATAIPAEVRLFLAVVRRELGDLDPEELTEITDGLEADLADLVAERGPDALGDPKAYARELRTAAGITEGKPVKVKRPIRASVDAFLDACHAWFDHQVARIPGDTGPVLAWLQPAWWVLRAWVAVQLIDLVFGGGSYNGGLDLLPSLFGILGAVVLFAAIFVSIQIGRGRFWPGGQRGLLARLVLLGLNGFAIAMVPVVLSNVNSGYDGQQWDEAWQSGYQQGQYELTGEQGYADGDAAGTWLSLKGKPVHNIYAYDSQGRRMAGVQLFDQDGRPLEVAGHAICPRSGEDGDDTGKEQREGGDWVCYDHMAMKDIPGLVLYPWTNGQAQLKNVFPLASRVQETLDPSPSAFQEAEKPTLGVWPFAEVPRVSLPGITSGILEGPQKAPEPATTP